MPALTDLGGQGHRRASSSTHCAIKGKWWPTNIVDTLLATSPNLALAERPDPHPQEIKPARDGENRSASGDRGRDRAELAADRAAEGGHDAHEGGADQGDHQ